MKNICRFILSISVFVAAACNHLIEKSIRGSTVILEVPGNNYQNAGNLNPAFDGIRYTTHRIIIYRSLHQGLMQ
jgi:hypothetical protein